MSTEENKRIVRPQFEELINNKNFAALEDLAEDFIDHEAPPGQPVASIACEVVLWLDEPKDHANKIRGFPQTAKNQHQALRSEPDVAYVSENPLK